LAGQRELNRYCNVIDESANTAITPPPVLDTDALFNLAMQYKAHFVISGSAQKLGLRNSITVSMLDAQNGRTTRTNYLIYNDALDLWVKLPKFTRELLDSGRAKSRSDPQVLVWEIFRSGVNRSEAETLTSLLMTNISALGNFSVINNTRTFEKEISGRNGTVSSMADFMMDTIEIPNSDWQRRVDYEYGTIKNKKPGKDAENRAIAWLKNDSGFSMTGNMLFMETSRRGNGYRLDVVRENHSGYVYMDYSSMQDFIRQMQGFSLMVINLLNIPSDLSGAGDITAYIPKPVNPPALPSADFVKLSGKSGVLPLGGLYLSRYKVTQKEYQTLMGKNPSAVNGENLPVTNVTEKEQQAYCDALSLRDGLLAPDAYRLPTAEEWEFARAVGREKGVSDANSSWYTDKNSGGFRVARPFYDYWQYAAEGAYAATEGPATSFRFVTAPSLPKILPAAGEPKDSSVVLTWENPYKSVDDRPDFNIYRGTSPDPAQAQKIVTPVLGKQSPIKWKMSAASPKYPANDEDVFTYTAENLEPGKTYYFWISAQWGLLGFLESEKSQVCVVQN
jgi:formylglycine-generating enzyme required for sulfatase activity